MDNPIKDLCVLGAFLLVSPLYLFCDVMVGGLS